MHTLIIGGGIMGASTAWFLASEHGAQVTVLERDPLGRRASSSLSASSIRQQFTCAINVALSQWSLAFLREAGPRLREPGFSAGLHEQGYLYLATPHTAAAFQAHHATQRALGADVALLDAAALNQRFAWLHADDLALGSLGCSGEGWFDGPGLWQAFRRAGRAAGVRALRAEVQAFETKAGRIIAAIDGEGQRHAADAFVLCTGAWSADLSQQLGMPLPVSASKRDVFVVEAPQPLPGCPLVIDTSGVWFRPEGRGFICGAPPRGPDTPGLPLEDIDYGLFDEVIWPALAHRVPAFEALRVRSAWAGYYEMNDADHNGLAGPLPGWQNAYAACGFSGHGMQQAPAVGHALAALMAGGRSTAPDLAPLFPGRLQSGQLLREQHII